MEWKQDSWLVERGSKGQTKVEGGRSVAVMAQNWGRQRLVKV